MYLSLFIASYIPSCIPFLLCYYCAMAVEVKARWSPDWRRADGDILRAYRGMQVEPGFYSSPLQMPPKDAFLQHSVNGDKKKPVFPTVRAAMEEAIIVYAKQKNRSDTPETVGKAA